MAGACIPDEPHLFPPAKYPHWTDGLNLTEEEKVIAQKGYDKGYEEGRIKGYEEGRNAEKQFQKEVREALSRW